jgi:CheY-like chemotaxis protein
MLIDLESRKLKYITFQTKVKKSHSITYYKAYKKKQVIIINGFEIPNKQGLTMPVEKKSILIVDDEEDTLEMLSFVLEHEDYITWRATNGEEALKLVKKNPDVILLDIRMPGISGLEVCRRLKHDDKFKHIPIIIFSAKVLSHDIALGLEAGADEYLTKPFSTKELTQLIKKYLS